MPALEVIVRQLPERADISPDFRLFLTSLPASYFPVHVLQNGIKLTTEPPRGLKANLRRSWSAISQQNLDGATKQRFYHKLVWGLTYFHAIVQERRKFGPLGWNIAYEFNDSDLDTSTTVLQMLIDQEDEVPWDSILFVCGHINYGGRVTDDWDRRCLITILKKFFQKEILADDYRFSDAADYLVPTLDSLQAYRAFIEGLPQLEEPAVFGMHENAHISY